MTTTAITVKDGAGSNATIYANDDPATGALQGALTETAPATDTASSGANGRLQRIAQRLTSLIALWNAGAGTAAAALRTTLASDDPAVSSLSTLAGTVSSARAAVNPISGQIGVAGGSGVTGATVQRVVLATDVALPAGTAILGKIGIDQTTDGTTNLVAAKQSGTWNVGSITTLPALVAGSAVVGKVGIDQTTDGTTNLVAAKQSGTWNVGTVTTVSAVTAISNALPAGTNAIGKLSANSGVDIGDVDVTSLAGGTVAHDGVGTSISPLLVGGYASAAAPTNVSADGDAVRAWMLRNGALAVQLTAAGTLITSGAGTAATAIRTTLASDDPLVAAQTRGGYKSSFTITRPANTTLYTVNDAYADSGPTSGGFTLASVVGASGKSGELTHLIFDGSAAQTTPLIAELWLYDASVTAITDNAAFSSSATPIAIIPFSMTNIGSKSYAMVDCNHIVFTPSGTADLRALVRVVNAYTPVSGETLKVQALTKGIN